MKERIKRITLPKPGREPLFLLVFTSFCLLFVLGILQPVIRDKGNRYLNAILWQFLIFLIPVSIYLRLKGKSYLVKLRFNRLRIDHVFVIVFASIALLSGSMLLGAMLGLGGGSADNFALYGQFVAYSDDSAVGISLLIITFALIPAICEETLFRAMICAEFEKRIGVTCTVIMSGLFFGLLHFSLRMFPIYFFAGVILCAVMYITRSSVGAIAVHFIYNAACVFFRSGFVGFYRTASNTGLLTIILIATFLVSSAIVCFESSRLYKSYAKNNLSSDYRGERVRLLEIPKMLGKALFTYGALGCLAIYIIALFLL